MKFNTFIDHTILKATATKKDILQLCEEAKKYQFFSVCVNSSWVSLAKEVLSGSDVKICAVVGFPLGAMSTEAKIFEAERAILAGADEIDMVINIGYLQSGMSDAVKEEIAGIKKAIGNKILKVIIETCYLTDDEKKQACELAVLARADFVKTSTGFGTGGASLEDTALMLEAVKGAALVKASGGVRDRRAAEAYIKQGVMRLGTSNGIAIVENLEAGDTY